MKQRYLAAVLSLALTGCGGGGGPSLSEKMEQAGWKSEPVLKGAEMERGQVSPAACEKLFSLLGHEEDTDTTRGFKKGEAAYLLVREWNGAGFPGDVSRAAEACPAMSMAYGPTTLTYTVAVEDKGDQTRLRLTARESGQVLAELLLGASEASGRNRLVRVMNARDDGTQALQVALTSPL
ncbi:hypothetical protein OG625_07805 [Streptomyces sp. NBC_01351]|uniref:hypothetical protein n=1 Tax=Streptomyces sp. NBC_01351 TaxID=2903833 RepID=UPI002E33BDFE|nr:hypothetical protein [Streptomyces sp. NBC_01351]